MLRKYMALLSEGGKYPRDEGDVVVIGPECFAAKDGSMLCWRGVNYVRQETK